MIRTRRDRLIATYIQEMGDHIRRQGNELIMNTKKIKKLMKRNNELEEELKFTRDGYVEEIVVLLEKHEYLKRKLGLPLEDHKRESAKEIRSKDYIILDDTDMDSDANVDIDDDYVDEARADIMESSSDESF